MKLDNLSIKNNKMAKNLISNPDNANEWKNNLQQYDANKKTLEWGSNPKQQAITHKVVKERDNIFNPILQVYNNKDYENNLKIQEQGDMVKTLAKNKDRSLRYEQTFDLISLKDKLKGFENHPDYPKEKTAERVVKTESTKVNYNILSNKNLKEHHYNRPEKRPDIPDVEGSRATKINAMNYRDYDVISNKYKEFHTEKMKADFEIQKLTAAKNYWKTHDYDPLLVKYIDDDKEKDFQKVKKDKEKNWGKEQLGRLPPSVKGEGLLYNPVNMQVVDETGLKNADLKRRNKKKRYEIKYEMDDFYKNRDFVRDDAKRQVSENKYSYNRFKEIDQRGFNILNNNNTADDYKNTTKLKDKSNNWEKLVNFAADNNTILKKEIYKDPYDYSDNSSKSKAFINKRKEFLNQLPNIDSDNNFSNPYKNTLYKENSVKSSENNMMNVNNNNNSNRINKDKWFKDKRENIAEPSKEHMGMNCLQKSLSASNNRKNNLYYSKHIVSA